jgi:hypothetical protein
MDEKHTLDTDDNAVATGNKFSRRDFLKISGSGVFIFFVTGVLGGIAPPQNRRSYPTDFNCISENRG